MHAGVPGRFTLGTRIQRMLAVQALADAFAPGASPEACASLAQTLAQVAREDEPGLLEGLAKTDVVARAIAFAQSEEADQKVLQSVLVSLVNLAAMGGVALLASSRVSYR